MVADVGELWAALGDVERAPGGVEWTRAEWARVWAALTPRERSVVLLVAVRGYSVTAAAADLGIGRGAADAAWSRALVRIRAVLTG